MHLRRALVTLVLLLTLGAPTDAQDTGGSFGGGFDDDSSSSSDSGSDDSSGSSDSGSDDSSGSSDSGSDSSGSSDSGSSSSDWSSSDSDSSGGTSEPMTWEQWKVVFKVSGVIASIFACYHLLDRRARRRASAARATNLANLVNPKLHLVTAQLAIDWRARRDLQERLAALARSGKAGNKQGRVELLKETVLALVRAELSWLYSRWNAVETPKTEAEGAFRAATVDARARFKREVVRDAGGVVEQQAVAAPAPSAADGPGVVVVSLFVASAKPLTPPAPAPSNAAALRSALQGLLALGPTDLVALEVVWSPAVETDRMSTAELEQLYPELALIDPASVAGRVFCAHCTGPYAKELMTCPHCGAPAAA